MEGSRSIPGASSLSFLDADQYHAAIRGGDSLLSFLGRGVFRADVTTIELGQVTLQHGRENLPRLSSSGMPAGKVGLLGWFGDGELPIVRGVQMRRGDWMCLGPGMQSHHRSSGPIDFVTLTLDASDLNQAAIDLTGTELTVAGGKVLRPPARLGAAMLSAFEAGIRATGRTPDIFASPKATDALEHALLRPMVMGLLQGEASNETTPRSRHSALAKRFEAAVEANFNVPLLIRDLCRLVGASERTLRTLCWEQLGVSPQRFLALRRLHLARRALLRSDAQSATVTEIATRCGSGNLGDLPQSTGRCSANRPRPHCAVASDTMIAPMSCPLETLRNFAGSA